MDGELQIVPHNPAWVTQFEAEASRIRKVLGSLALRIDHHGSTSVPGLAAKPIIDIQVSVKSLTPIETYCEPLQAIGYHHLPHEDDSFCPFFHRPFAWPHTHHVHIVRAGGEEEQRTLAFRDYLRDHVDQARAYEQLKRQLAARLTPKDAAAREAYAQAKTSFIERIIQIALETGYPRVSS